MKKTNGNVSAIRIREIRTATGMTQQQFADEIGVGKVTVARWESGTRKCHGDYANRVRRIAVERSAELVRTTTIFDVRRDQLLALESTDAVEAFRDLLWCECRRLRVPTSEVQIGTLEIADGGIDAVVPAIQKRDSSDSFLADGANYFQIKAGSSWKPWQPSFARKELLGKQKRLGRAVESCLMNNGRYVLVSFGTDLTPDQRQSAKSNIEAIFAEVGFADTKVDVWGQQELLGHFRRFPFLSLRLSNREDIQFQSWSSWNLSSEMMTDLELGEAQKRLRDEIRRLIRDVEISHIRVIGEPGLGKTRLVHEALAAEDLAPQVVYIQHAEDFQKSRLFHHLLHPDADYFLILVLDECRPRECAEIWDRLSKHSDRCQVVSLDHDSFQPGDPQFVELECPRLDNEHLGKIIDAYSSGGGDSRRWAEFCSGVPRVAHAIGRNLQTNPADLLKAPSMELVWERFISGYRSIKDTESRQKLIVLRYISLFHRFGFESPVQTEGKFIAELIHEDFQDISYSRFQEIVAELKQQRILQGKTTLFIAPKLLHIHLWTQFWESHGRNHPINELIRSIPNSLTSWFVRMFPYAEESPVALEHVKRVLGPDGPFSDPEFALSSIGCHFLHKLANASPKHTLQCLKRVFGQITPDDLLAFDKGRQDIVWALERIAVWPPLFRDAARLLRTLAESENATNSNNSTGTFTELFCLAPGQVAPTGAPPEVRFPVLAETLDAVSEDTRRLGIKACKIAMDIHAGIRVVGREYQGLTTAELWTPETWGEVHTAMGQVWDELFNSSRAWNTELRSEANEVLVSSVAGLLRIPSLSDRVLVTVEKLADDKATDLKQLVQGFARIRRFWKDDYGSDVLQRLSEIDSKITGSSFSDRLRRIVHLSGWDDRYDGKSRDEVQFNQCVRELAIEAAESDEGFHDVLRGLVRGTNNVVFQFGREFSLHDEGRHLQDTIEAYRSEAASVSDLFISGYLAAVFDKDPVEWEHVVRGLLNEEAFNNIIGSVIRNSGWSGDVILWLLNRYDSGAIDINCLLSFGYSRCLKELEESTLLAFMERIAKTEHIAFVLELLDFVYCDKDKPRQLPESETMEILKMSGRANSRNQGVDYHWSVVADQFLKQFPSRRTELFEAALAMIEDRNWSLDEHNQAYAVLQSIIQADRSQCWRILASRINAVDGIHRYRLIDWLGPSVSFASDVTVGPLTNFPMHSVFDWVAEDPECRARELIHVVPKSLARDELGGWARELLNRYGDQEDVRLGLLSHFRSGGWSGKASERYRRLRDEARAWLDEETSMRVRQWLGEYIECLSIDIERAEIEEEREF